MQYNHLLSDFVKVTYWLYDVRPSVCLSVPSISRKRLGIFKFCFRQSIAYHPRTFTSDFETDRITATVRNRYDFKILKWHHIACSISFDSSLHTDKYARNILKILRHWSQQSCFLCNISSSLTHHTDHTSIHHVVVFITKSLSYN